MAQSEGERPILPNTLAPPRSGCPFCGAHGLDQDGTACVRCGAKITAVQFPATTSARTPLSIGDLIAGGAVLSTRGTDELRIARGNEILTVILASSESLATESRALRNSTHGAFPSFLELGVDAEHGNYLALSSPPESARPLAIQGSGLTPMQTLDLIETVVEAAEVLWKASLAWYPEPADFWVEGRALRLSRLRVVEVTSEAGADVGCPLGALGTLLLPGAATELSPELVRALVMRSTVRPRTSSELREMIARARERITSPFSGIVCGVTDVGLKRPQNEDYFATATGPDWSAFVVCDGVSSSSRGGVAAEVAAKHACAVLERMAIVDSPLLRSPSRAVEEAIRAAHRAACAIPPEPSDRDPPGTTIVAALVHKTRLAVGWVGDSRAYFVGNDKAEQLTRDHSWANELVSRGEMSEVEASFDPMAHALTKCLGPLEDRTREAVADVVERELTEPGYVVVCSDGFWNYFPSANEVAQVLRSVPESASLRDMATSLVCRAMTRGGHDNATVALYKVEADSTKTR